MCRITMIAVAAAVLSAVAVFSSEVNRFVLAAEKDVGVYERRDRALYDKPVFMLENSRRCLVVADELRHYKIRNAEGLEGWVEKRLVEVISTAKAHMFEGVAVPGYIDIPALSFVDGNSAGGTDSIFIDRSFADHITINIHRESIERITMVD